MAVEFITGRPGGGKSLLAVKMIEEEMRTTKRAIVTNVPLRLEEWAALFGAVEVMQRIRVLDAGETMAFWLLGPGWQIDYRRRKTWESPDGRSMEVVDLEQRPPGGILYVIDECHIPFSSRAFYKTNVTDAFYYLSQHEKLGDSVLMVTQHCENVDKQFRSVAQAFIEVRNGYRERWPILGGLIRARPGFTSSEFPNPPGSGTQLATLKKKWKLDPEKTCKLYDTTKGLGLVSQAAARHEKKVTGLPWWSVLVAAGVVAVALVMIPELIGKAVGSGLNSMQKGVAGAVQGGSVPGLPATPSPAKPARLTPLEAISPFGRAIAEARPDASATNRLELTSWAYSPPGFGGQKAQFTLYFSDGRKVTKGFRFLNATEIEFEGRVYQVK